MLTEEDYDESFENLMRLKESPTQKMAEIIPAQMASPQQSQLTVQDWGNPAFKGLAGGVSGALGIELVRGLWAAKKQRDKRKELEQRAAGQVKMASNEPEIEEWVKFREFLDDNT